MNQTMIYLKKHQNKFPIIISAQTYLQHFYQDFGFQTIGESYDEDGIPHIKMLKQFDV